MRQIDAEPLEKILRLRCAQYSNDYGSLAGAISGCLKLVQAQPTLTPPPNDPLTLEELREMNDADVWVAYPTDLSGDRLIMHALVEYDNESENVWLTNNLGGRSTFDEISEDGGLAYHRKPEEGVSYD